MRNKRAAPTAAAPSPHTSGLPSAGAPSCSRGHHRCWAAAGTAAATRDGSWHPSCPCATLPGTPVLPMCHHLWHLHPVQVPPPLGSPSSFITIPGLSILPIWHRTRASPSCPWQRHPHLAPSLGTVVLTPASSLGCCLHPAHPAPALSTSNLPVCHHPWATPPSSSSTIPGYPEPAHPAPPRASPSSSRHHLRASPTFSLSTTHGASIPPPRRRHRDPHPKDIPPRLGSPQPPPRLDLAPGEAAVAGAVPGRPAVTRKPREPRERGARESRAVPRRVPRPPPGHCLLQPGPQPSLCCSSWPRLGPELSAAPRRSHFPLLRVCV